MNGRPGTLARTRSRTSATTRTGLGRPEWRHFNIPDLMIRARAAAPNSTGKFIKRKTMTVNATRGI